MKQEIRIPVFKKNTNYCESSLLINRNIWKWALFIFRALPFFLQIYAAKQIIFVLSVTLGLCKGLLLGNQGFNPMGAFEGISDIILSIRQRRGQEEIHRMHAKAEDALRNAKTYAESQKHQSHKSADSEKVRFREEIRQERERQEQEAKGKSQAKQKSTASTSRKSENESTQLDSKNLADAYEILGVPYGANLQECKKARLTL